MSLSEGRGEQQTAEEENEKAFFKTSPNTKASNYRLSRNENREKKGEVSSMETSCMRSRWFSRWSASDACASSNMALNKTDTNTQRDVRITVIKRKVAQKKNLILSNSDFDKEVSDFATGSFGRDSMCSITGAGSIG
jgi:hypothetical protein